MQKMTQNIFLGLFKAQRKRSGIQTDNLTVSGEVCETKGKMCQGW